MSEFQPAFPGYEAKIRASFARQSAMQTLGVTMELVAPGRVSLGFAHDPAYEQQHGFLHGGIVSAILDSACGYAAFTLMPEEAGILTTDLNCSFLAPTLGERYEFRGEVLKPGRNLVFVEAEAIAIRNGVEKRCAKMRATMMTVLGRKDVVG